jgi:hypothetical protein
MSTERLTWVKSERARKFLVVSPSLEIVTEDLVYDRQIESVEFSTDSTRLKSLGDFAFHECFRLKSICIPASVELIGQNCFGPASVSDSSLESLTFESGSKLRKIGSQAFNGCRRLRSISLAASVSEIDGKTFEYSHFERIAIESDNLHFRIRAHFILNWKGLMVIVLDRVSLFVQFHLVQVRDFVAFCRGHFSAVDYVQSRFHHRLRRLRRKFSIVADASLA